MKAATLVAKIEATIVAPIVAPIVLSLLLAAAAGPAQGLTDLLYDAEPNNAPHQAIPMALPDGKDSVRILGELDGGDQDAYRLVVDEDDAGKRLDLGLSGRAGALTQVDVFDFTELADGRGRIPETLTQRPDKLYTLATTDGARTVQTDALLLQPGVYVLGVSHSGGEGTYTVSLSEHDDTRVKVLEGDEGTQGDPERVSPNGDIHVWTQGETWYEVELDEREAGEWAYTVVFQSALGRPATLQLFGPDETELLTMESSTGMPVARPGLKLAPGSYRVRTEQQLAGTQILAFERSAPAPADGREVEPNDAVPTPIAFGEPFAGRFDGSDTDWLAFHVDAAQAQQRFDLRVHGGPESAIEVCLLRRSMNLSHCVRGRDGLTEIASLGLAEGEYRLRLGDRGPDGADWRLEWVDRGQARVGEELEPNDKHDHPVALHPRGFGRGRFDGGRESDHWRLDVTGEPQLWRLQLQGDDLHEITLKSGGGKVLASERAGGTNRARLDNLFLMPGEYVIAAQGNSGDYILRAQPLGPPPPGMEIEPNDDVADARLMRFGQEYFGTLSEDGDDDRYRFTLLGHEHVRITVQPPVDGGIRGYLGVGDLGITISEVRNGNKPGEPLAWDAFLPPGDYQLWLRSGDLSDAEYTATLERLDWFDDVTDREPNDFRADAAPFPADGRIRGRVGNTARARDWYRLPAVEQPLTLSWPDQDGIRVRVYDDAEPGEDRATFDRETDRFSVELHPGLEYRLMLRGNGEYDLDLSALAAGDAPAGPAPTVALSLEPAPVQAFSEWAQEVRGELVVTNPGAAAREIELETHLTDRRWSLHDVPDRVSVGAGESRRIAFRIRVAPDAVARPPVRLSARARAGAVHSAVAAAEIEVAADAVPVRPTFHWPLDPPLRGRLNAAAARFGAEPVDSPGLKDKEVKAMGALFDGLARYGRWTGMSIPIRGDDPAAWAKPTIRLAGDAPVPVRGFLINPTSILDTNRYMGEFAIAVSLDGEHFRTVLADRLLPASEEQAFVLPEPVQARYVRLLPLGAAHGDASSWGSVALGEFKVVAAPDWRPQDQAFNLADPANGGHLVHASPWIRGSAFDTGVLVADDEAPSPRLRDETGAAVVIGFEHARVARIDRVEIDPMAVDDGSGPESVRVFTAIESPLGPWQEVAGGELGAEPLALALAEPVWARYVRVVFELPEGARSARYPDRIAVFEAEGPSVLGEWGHLADIGPYEQANTPQWTGLAGAPDNDSRERAMPLPPGMSRPGRALLDAYSSWYRLEVPEGRNLLRLSVSGRPAVEGKPRLFDAAGEPVDVFAGEATPTEQRWEAWVEPGGSYLLEVYEPPRSVIFSWDTSGSVAAWLPVIANALMNYAETIRPGRDEVNLLPFGRGQPLLRNWQGYPYPLMRMLVAYPQETSSSAAEGTLAVAAREMIDRPGKKAVLLLTDAATTSDAELWPALREGRPQVFSMKLSSVGAFGGDPQVEADLMQDWAKVRGGHFEYITGMGVLARGFDRAVARLKRPVDFAVSAAYETVEDPSPATIRVDFGGDAGGGGDAAMRGAVEIILDASGSMLKRMDGTRRIDIAKAAIRDTVENSLPEGLPLALRVYGHREAGSCRTDLEIPLGPLDKSAFLGQVADIQAINLARTPIADSLAAVSSDLAGAEGRKLVVLLTDGEETCDGDPAGAITKLAESGVDVRVNIVGFAIDDEALKREFSSWAELGGGTYLDAAEAATLGQALDTALKVPFTVLDAGGEEIARGLVGGEPVEVPAGRYSVRVDTAAPYVERGISLAPGDRHEIELE